MKNRDGTLIQIVALVVTALAGLPAAYMVGRSTYFWLILEWFKSHIEFWPGLGAGIAVVTGLVVEGLGIVSLYLWSAFDRWNRAKATREDGTLKRGYDLAPAGLALACFVGYGIAVVTLLVVLEWKSEAARFAPVLFPVLTAVGGLCWSLYDQHRDRLAYHGLSWNWVRLQEPESKVQEPETATKEKEKSLQLDETFQGMIAIWQNNPQAKGIEIASTLGTSESTVSRRKRQLEKMGVLQETETGIKVNGNHG